ncbi:MAG: hypothetical protein MJY96_03315 [Bacteroidaceae bacterium]|nr:hypothetical protein [Bacteroidaceae bacterium]
MAPRGFIELLGAVLVTGLCMSACDKEKESDEPVNNGSFLSKLDTHSIEAEIVEYDTAITVTVPASKYSFQDTVFEYPERSAQKAIDVKLKVLPVYAFGNSESSGDYYAVQAAVIAHNSLLYSETQADYCPDCHKMSDYCGYYMGRLDVDCQLLDSLGKAVTYDNVEFHIQPNPKSTMASGTYTKGFDFTLDASITLGAAKANNPKTKQLAWGVTALGNVGFGFNWYHSEEQVIPDQTVTMTTSTKDRSVSYEFITNHDDAEVGTKHIPATFRTDQSVDLAWVWHVRSGNYCAKDYDFGHMKLKVTVRPKYRYSFSLCYDKYDASVKDWYTHYAWEVAHEASVPKTFEMVVDLPPINRIPIGTVAIKNTTRYYMANVKMWRAGEYANGEEPYLTIKGTYDQNEVAGAYIREGKYDILFDLVSGDGDPHGTYIIANQEIKADETLNQASMNGRKLGD